MFYRTDAFLVDWRIHLRPEHHIMAALSKRLAQQNSQFRLALSQCVKAAHEGRDLSGEGVKLAIALSSFSETVGFNFAVVSMTGVVAAAYNNAVTMSTEFQHIRGNILQVRLSDTLRADGFTTTHCKDI
jgi:hypothetical protein